MHLNNLISLCKETVAFPHLDNEQTAFSVIVSHLDIHYDVELLSLFSFSLKVPITVNLTNQKFL